MYITLIKNTYIFLQISFIFILFSRERNKEPDFSQNFRKLLKEAVIAVEISSLITYKSGNHSEESLPEECTRLSHRSASTAEIDPSVVMEHS